MCTAIFLFIPILFPLLLEAANDKKTIVIASLEYPPFVFLEDGRVKGVIYEIVKETFGRLGVEIEVDILPVKRGLKMVAEGKVDAYFSLKKTSDRMAVLLFSETPILHQEFVILTLNDSGFIYKGRLEELKDYKVGLQCNTSYGPVVDNAIKSKLISRIDCGKDTVQNIKKLLAGRVDLVVSSLDVGKRVIEKLGVKNVVIVSPSIDYISSYIAFTKDKDHSELATLFDKVFNEMIRDGTVDKIKESYNEDISVGY
ncbi:transporter substrate-binding domain-containing protein [Shewanella algae]|uniref:substrate-binding periplasmic protein n=1 Tax=Shewanella algae TaxID=38313 RepID=UPI001AAC887B|nr:transporter substrate-binding domain-containing protein [Shewanella algae]MBO2559756.1 transporter substrate-binding domain-containing protein [Shewanella algae]